IYNLDDQLIDIAWSELPNTWPIGEKIQPGKTVELDVDSISQTGRCLGKGDPRGTKIRYWVNTLTFSDQPLSKSYEEQIDIN
ncbi:MAG: hypothetical protein AAGD96_14340, partial [Chloroflexota bacterium]